YRKQLNPSCSCRAPGQSWADALRQGDDFVERGDIVVTEERARQLSQPRLDAQGKPLTPESSQERAGPASKSANAGASAPATATPKPEEKADEESGKRKVRAVGPTFFPVRTPANHD